MTWQFQSAIRYITCGHVGRSCSRWIIHQWATGCDSLFTGEKPSILNIITHGGHERVYLKWNGAKEKKNNLLPISPVVPPWWVVPVWGIGQLPGCPSARKQTLFTSLWLHTHTHMESQCGILYCGSINYSENSHLINSIAWLDYLEELNNSILMICPESSMWFRLS